MSRLMSVALTEQAVIERRKTVTRRLGWWQDKRGRRMISPGDRLTLCRLVRGVLHPRNALRHRRRTHADRMALPGGIMSNAPVGRPAELKTPAQWSTAQGVHVIDADGWRQDSKPWDTPITLAEFERRLATSTAEHRVR